MAYSYIDVDRNQTEAVVLEGLDPSFFIALKWSKAPSEDGAELDFKNPVYPSVENLGRAQMKIKLNAAPQNGEWQGAHYRVFRCTRFDRMLYDFAAGSRFDALTYQRNWLQLLHLYQEIIEGRLVLDLIGRNAYSQGGTHNDSRIAELEKQLAGVQEQYEDAEREIALQKGLVAFEKGRVVGFEVALQQERQKVADKEQALSTAQQTIQRLQTELEEARQNSSSGSGGQNCSELEDRVSELEIEKQQLQTQLGALQNNSVPDYEIKAMLRKARDNRSDLESVIQTLKDFDEQFRFYVFAD